MESSPRDDSVIQAQIDEVVLTFDVPIRAEMSSVVVEGLDGRSFSLGGVQVVGSTVHQSVYPLTSGFHTVEWQVYSTDGVRTSGQYPFTVHLTPGREPTAMPPPTALDPPHVKTNWVVVGLLAAAALTLAAALWWAVTDRRRARDDRKLTRARRP